MSRPTKPDRELPEGLEFVAVEESAGWEAVGSISHGCRWTENHSTCGKPTVARLDRSHRGPSPRWYYYCGDHMYGRWIEDGRVMSWHVREKADA